MTNLLRALTIAGVTAAAAVHGGAPASAAVSHDHYSFDAIFDIPDLCGSGLLVHGHATGSETDLVRTNEAGFPLFSGHVAGVTTFSSGGRTASVRYAGPFHDLKVVDNGNGTITVTTAVSGDSGVVSDGDGTQTYREAGRTLVQLVLDYAGTPANADDDVLLSETLLAENGPDGGEGTLCAAVVATLRG